MCVMSELESMPLCMSRPMVRVTLSRAYFLAAEVSVKYELEVTFQGRRWVIERGFSEIKEFRQKLPKGPSLPPCLLLHTRTNRSWKMISARRKSLDAFFVKLCSGEQYFTRSKHFDAFLEVERNLEDLTERPPPPSWLSTSWWCAQDDSHAYLHETIVSLSSSDTPLPNGLLPSISSETIPSTPAPQPQLKIRPEITSQLKKIAKRQLQLTDMKEQNSSAASSHTPSSPTSSYSEPELYNKAESAVISKTRSLPEDVVLCLALGRVRQEAEGIVIYFSTPKGTPRTDQRGRIYDVAVVYAWVCTYGDTLPPPQYVASFINAIWTGGHTAPLRACRWSCSTASSTVASVWSDRMDVVGGGGGGGLNIVITPPLEEIEA